MGSLFGAPIIVSPSTLVAIALLGYVWSLSDGTTLGSLTRGIILAVLLFASVLAHEVAHAVAARAYGRQVAEVALTLFGGHTAFDGRGLTPGPSAVIAVVGPVTNALIGAVCLVIGTSGALPGSQYFVWAGIVNIILAVFNLLPGLPMDGGRVAEAIIWKVTSDRERATIIAAWLGRITAVGLPVFVVVNQMMGTGQIDTFSALWSAAVGALLWQGASSALRAAQLSSRIRAVSVTQVMKPAVGVAADTSVATALFLAEESDAHYIFITEAGPTPVAYVAVVDARDVPPSHRETTSVHAVMRQLVPGAVVTLEANSEELITAAETWLSRTEVLAVMSGTDAVGIVSLPDLRSYLEGGKTPGRP